MKSSFWTAKLLLRCIGIRYTLTMKRSILIVLIIAIAFFIRIYHISSNPPGLTPDEASLGYNAYSILKTGKDEYGIPFPIVFKSFGDYKPGLYVYLTIPSVALFGLNEFSVRLPSIIAGVFTVFLVYLLSKKLFKNKDLALISLIIAASNPWLIYFSRGAWEVNVALTLTLSGIYFFLKSLKDAKFLIISSVFFASTLLTYQGAKLQTGIVLFILTILYWREIIKFKFNYLTLSFLMGVIISAPIIMSLFNGQGGRLAVFSVFSYPRPSGYLQSFLNEGNVHKNSIIYYLFYNEPLNFARGILGRFFNHFSAKFLFSVGDWSNPRHTPPYQGVLLIGDFIFILAVIYIFFREKLSKEKLFIILWTFLSVLPAILSRD